MRIACIYLPAFALQVHVRQAPHRVGTAFALIHGGDSEHGEHSDNKHSNRSHDLLVCSRAAWKMGLRPGMSAPKARALAPDVEVITVDKTLYQRALEALAESLMAHSLRIDIGNEGDCTRQANLAIYLSVPKKSEDESFAQALLTQLDRQGYKGRVGIADNRFTAWVAAKSAARASRGRRQDDQELFDRPIHAVPRGTSAVFLAPWPIELLPLSPDLLHILQTLGVKTLGDFAKLPPPSVGRRWNSEGIDFQSLAKGEGPTMLQSFSPHHPILESIDLEHEVSDTESLAFALRPLADRVCDRLRGRNVAVSRALLRLKGRSTTGSGNGGSSNGGSSNGGSSNGGDDHGCCEFSLVPTRPTQDGSSLFALLHARIQDLRLDQRVCALELSVVQESEPEIEDLDLFRHGVKDHQQGQAQQASESVAIAITRLESMFGRNSVNAAQLTESRRPEDAFHLTPFEPPLRKKARAPNRRSTVQALSRGQSSSHTKAPVRSRHSKKTRPQEVLPLIMNGTSGALRLLDPPLPQPGCHLLAQSPQHDATNSPLKGPGSITLDGVATSIVATHGPTKIDTEWWECAPLSREYYEVETEDGGRYWVFKKEEESMYYLHGIFD